MYIEYALRTVEEDRVKFSRLILLLEDVVQDQVNRVAKAYPEVNRELLVQMAADVDPTERKTHLMWIAKQMARGILKMPEDAPKTREALGEFEAAKANRVLTGPSGDIQRYPTFAALISKLHDISGDRQRAEKAVAQVHAGTKVVYDKPPWRVIEITTPEACVRLSKGAGWCVQHGEAAAAYLQDGPLYLIQRQGHRYALAHESSGSLKGVSDEPLVVDAGEANTLYEILRAAGLRKFEHEDLGSLRELAEASKTKEYQDFQLALSRYSHEPWTVLKVTEPSEVKLMTVGTAWPWRDLEWYSKEAAPLFVILRHGRRYAWANESYGKLRGLNGQELEADGKEREYDKRYGALRELYDALRTAGVEVFTKDLANLRSRAQIAIPKGRKLLMIKIVIDHLSSAIINMADSMEDGRMITAGQHELVPDETSREYADILNSDHDERGAWEKMYKLHDKLAAGIDHVLSSISGSRRLKSEVLRLAWLGMGNVLGQASEGKDSPKLPQVPRDVPEAIQSHMADRWGPYREKYTEGLTDAEERKALGVYEEMAAAMNRALIGFDA